MIIQPTLLIPLLPRKAIPLPGKAPEARLAIGREFLAIDQCTAGINDHIAAAEVIAQVELHRRPAIIRMRGTEPHQRNALCVVHHVHMVVLARLRLPAPAMMLEDAIDVMRDLDLAALLAHQLLHPLPGGVVEIVRMDRRLGALGLGAEGLHLIGMIPLEVARGRLRAHVAVGVEVYMHSVSRPISHATQPVVGRLDRECARKAARAVAVLQAQHVAHRVVAIVSRYRRAPW